MSTQMTRAIGGGDIQAFPLMQAARCGADSSSGASSNGTWENVSLITCVSDGGLTVTFPDGDATLTVTEGWVRCFPFPVTIQITSGNFDIAGA